MATPLRELLERRFGIGEDEFAAALEEFADRTGPLSIVGLRPTDYFTDAHQSVLTSGRAAAAPNSPTRSHLLAGRAPS